MLLVSDHLCCSAALRCPDPAAQGFDPSWGDPNGISQIGGSVVLYMWSFAFGVLMGRVPEWMRELSSVAHARADIGTAAGSPLGPKEHSKRIEDLFKAHNSALIRFLMCKLKSSQEAKEVAQEAYVRILQLDSVDGVSHLQAFLFKTAANLAADRIKTSVRRERIDRLDFFHDEEVTPAPEIGLGARQEIENVLAAVSALPPKCRYAFIMHRFHDHSIPDVARLMSVSERMVRIYIERAVVFCRKRLTSTGGGA